MVNCGDGSACMLDGTCDATTGECVGGENADDGTDCTIASNPGKCRSGACEDICTFNEVVCEDSNQCTDDSCDPADGECNFTAVADGSPCDFGDLPGRCVSGVCADASPPTVFLSEGAGVMSSDQYQMGISIGGPVAHGAASSTNYTLEFRATMNQ
jgi:hypothetical protein